MVDYLLTERITIESDEMTFEAWEAWVKRVRAVRKMRPVEVLDLSLRLLSTLTDDDIESALWEEG